GKDLGEVIGHGHTGIILEGSDCLEQNVFRTKPDVVVDFSTPEAALKNARIFARMKVNVVIGTTGFSDIGLKKLFILANKHKNAIVYAPNITLGINVLMLLANLAANILNSYDFQITEVHHKHKKDAPSGTAKKIAVEIEKGLAASGITDKEIPITAVRAGGVVGKHEVMIVGEDDKIEITHESFSRRVFALGAVKAIRFTQGKSGYFEMADVVNLKEILSDYLARENISLAVRYADYLQNREMKAQ
ncbi:MAG TPA: 4-hydroxy-tetrahydrodipicolinate reductase, partial [Bacillota bacterium]|nr:4-hydroxy-tetrahydrodipicolinate reductase [Bacillota bacterium]